MKDSTLTLSGRTIYPGLGEGRISVYRATSHVPEEFSFIEESELPDETTCLHQAFEYVLRELLRLSQIAEEELGRVFSEIFRIHLAFLNEPGLRSEIERTVHQRLVSAASAVKGVMCAQEQRLRRQNTELSRQRADDICDIAGSLLDCLTGSRTHVLDTLAPHRVLVVSRLLPSDLIELSRHLPAAIVVEAKANISYASLFARKTEIPCIGDIIFDERRISADSYALVDGENARVVLDPDKAERRHFDQRRRQRARKRKHELRHAPHGSPKAVGIGLPVFADVVCRQDSIQAAERGADGIGLFHIEAAYLEQQQSPDAGALVDQMWSTFEPLREKPVCVLLPNIPFLSHHSELLYSLIEALLTLSGKIDLSVLVPIVTLNRDIYLFEVLLKTAARKRSMTGVPRIGALIDTSSTVPLVRCAAAHADFLVFRTNGHSHDEVYTLLRIVRGELPDTHISVCGELAGSTDYIPGLLDGGVSSLSVEPSRIPMVKEAVRSHSVTHFAEPVG